MGNGAAVEHTKLLRINLFSVEGSCLVQVGEGVLTVFAGRFCLVQLLARSSWRSTSPSAVLLTQRAVLPGETTGGREGAVVDMVHQYVRVRMPAQAWDGSGAAAV